MAEAWRGGQAPMGKGQLDLERHGGRATEGLNFPDKEAVER